MSLIPFLNMTSAMPLTQLKEVWTAITMGQKNFPQLDYALRSSSADERIPLWETDCEPSIFSGRQQNGY
jgi:hypothetical protein